MPVPGTRARGWLPGSPGSDRVRERASRLAYGRDCEHAEAHANWDNLPKCERHAIQPLGKSRVADRRVQVVAHSLWCEG